MVANKLHFLLIPYIGPGPMIPMIDMAKLLAKQSNIMVTIATPSPTHHPLRSTLTGPSPPDFPSGFLSYPFRQQRLACLKAQKLEERYEMINPRPNCIISDKYMSWTGVPMITWPQFAEQFINEKLIVQILGVGVGVGANYVVHVVEEDRFGVKVESESVKKAIERVMGSTIEGDERRKRAKELGIISNNAIKVGGSSHLNLTLLIQDIMHLANTST
ncbi:hypothetical protein E3N88_45051 [Mikania micrantha]|uniref:Uncharacterized protein n=1 Tax=Mikania micrantha TaxID=192012 RepID=A0A5N6LAB2_9ASTR|nr:hypothetical protein E3N88_45051 [Mikania micrantha]